MLALVECIARFTGDCCVVPVLDLDEAVASPHHQARGLVRPAADGALQALFPARVDGRPPAEQTALRHTGPAIPT